MKKLSAEDKRAIAELADAIEKAKAAVDEFLQPVLDAMQEHYEGKSDKWKESDAGAAYDDWKTKFESIDPDELDTFAAALRELPEEPESA